MKIVIPDDYQGAVRGLECFARAAAHEVRVYRDTVTEIDGLARCFADAECLILIRELNFGGAFDQVNAFAAGADVDAVDPEALKRRQR